MGRPLHCHSKCGKRDSDASGFLDVKQAARLKGPLVKQARGAVAFTIGRLIVLQNLIPLCIRPFRLVLPSERLRSARIVLLKATHLPFVGAIWAYEQLADAGKREPMQLSFSGPQTPVPSKRPPRLPVNSPRLLMADAQAAPNTPGRVHHANRPHANTGPSESDDQLKTLVLRLTTQVEELTVMVSRLQEQREASKAV